MSLPKSFRILRRCLNTAVSDSKTIRGGQPVSDFKSNFNGHPESGSQSLNHGQKIPEQLADRANALHPALLTVAKVSIFTGIAAAIVAIVSWWNVPKLKARLDDANREVELVGVMQCQVGKVWQRRAEALKRKKFLTRELKRMSTPVGGEKRGEKSSKAKRKVM